MNRKLLYLATIILTLAGCTSEDYVGNEELHRQNENGKPIEFSLIAAPQTRAVTGPTAAGLLNNNFVVYARKSFTGGADPQVVFNNYQANYGSSTAGTTTSNSSGWEYVGYTNVPDGVTTNVGVTAFSALTGTGGANENGVTQSIKYWDYSADKYEFYAYSLGEGATSGGNTTWAKSSPLARDLDSDSDTPDDYSYTLTGSQAELSTCYISDLVTKENLSALTSTAVQLPFRQMESKIKIAFYETIPGYSVKDLKFYKSASVASEAFLYATGTGTIPTGGKYTITFDASSGRPLLAFDGTVTDASSVTELSFDEAVPTTGTTWTDWVAAEYNEKVGGSDLGTVYLGRSSSSSTKSPSVSVLPNPDGTDLGLKIDYTLVALDGYGETINVTGATASVPAAYAQWQPNCSYTYVFKISDNTNGAIGAITGLHPITLDAVVNTNADGKQETITTVSAPSITTYQKGSNVTGMDEYYAGNIYVVVGDGGDDYVLQLTGTDANAKLYTVTNIAGSGAQEKPAQGITESAVENVLANATESSGTWALTDANGWTMTVSATDELTVIDEIPGDDAPHGKDIDINGACFTATAGTSTKYYVFEYTYVDNITDPSHPETKHLYKVIKVSPITTYQKGVTSTEEYQAGNIYFWVADGSTALTLGIGANLYTVTNVAGSSAQAKPEKEISEASVADVLKETLTDGKYTKTDANGWIMTVTPVASSANDKLATFTTIPAADSSSGSADNSKEGVTFAAIAGKIYVLEYIVSSSEKYYKVIKVAPAS